MLRRTRPLRIDLKTACLGVLFATRMLTGCSNNDPAPPSDTFAETTASDDASADASPLDDVSIETDATTAPTDTASGDTNLPDDVPLVDAMPDDTAVNADATPPADVAADDTHVGTDTSPRDETVRVRTEPCERIPNAASRCESFEITCAGADPTVVDVAVYEPRPDITDRGVILFGSGGGGTGYYNFPDRNRLLSAGYTVLERRWLGDQGWFSDANAGPAQASCRFAALARHYASTLARDVPLCATGNSGGSAELVYAMTWHGAGDALTFAMPTSGPFHRLDLFCQGGTDAAWTAAADTFKSNYCPDCVAGRYQAGGGVISLIDASFGANPYCSTASTAGAEALRAASPDRGPDFATLGETPIHLKIGKLDDGPFAYFVIALYEGLVDAGANVTLTFFDRVGHEMDQYEDGVTFIGDALIEHCR